MPAYRTFCPFAASNDRIDPDGIPFSSQSEYIEIKRLGPVSESMGNLRKHGVKSRNDPVRMLK